MRFGCARAVNLGLLPVLVVVLAGCLGGGHALGTPDSQSIPVGPSTHTLQSGGTPRTYHLYRPQGLSEAAPLVVMLHGGFGNGEQAERAYHWDAEADAGHFLVAYPDGLGRAWNAGTCCGEPAHAGTDDVGFVNAVVGAIAAQIPVDRARVYVTGMSNGAMMALRLGCQSDTFAAIAPVAGTLLTDCSACRSTAPPTTACPMRADPERRSRSTAPRGSTGRRWNPSTPPGAPSTPAGRPARPPPAMSPPRPPAARTAARWS